MNNNYIDCLGMSEINIYWPLYSTRQKIQERTRGRFEITVSAAAHIQHNIKIRKQPGGYVIIAKG